jgi:hypothetical protein
MFSALHLSTSRHGTRTRLCGSLTRCRARRHLASCCSSRRLDRPALDTRLARKSYLSAGRSNRLGRRTGVLTVSPASPLTGVGGRPQPCLAARASSRSHARASAPAPPPEPALAVSLCTGCGRAVAELISTCPSGDVSPLPAPLAGRRTWQRAPMTPVSQCSICFLVLITVHKHDHTPHSMTTAESGRQEASVPPHPPTKREEPRDELCSSSAWPQTAPLTPRPVGRMGAVRACLERRQSSALVYARRAEGRALSGPEAGSGALGARWRWLAPVFLRRSAAGLADSDAPQPPPAREASEASLPPLRATKGSMRACHRGCKACGQRASPRGGREEGCTATARMVG